MRARRCAAACLPRVQETGAGRPLKARERPPRPLLLLIAEQIDALPEAIEDYLAAERIRQRQ